MNEPIEHRYSGTMLERSILGILTGQGSLLDVYVLNLRQAFFRVREHRLIFRAMLELNQANLPVDRHLLLNLLHALEEQHNWTRELDSLLLLSEQHERLPYLVRQLEERYVEERMSELAVVATDASQSREQRIRVGMQILYELRELQSDSHASNLKQVLEEILKTGNVFAPEQKVLTGFSSLDKGVGGAFELQQVIVVGARPGVGKSGFLCSLVNHWSKEKQRKVLYISFQLNTHRFLQAMLGVKTGIALQDLNNPAILQSQQEAMKELADAEEEGYLQFHGMRSNDVEEVLAAIANRKQQNGLDIVVVDTLQQLEHGQGNGYITRNNDLGRTLRKLKHLAANLNLLLIIGSELSRMVERRVSISCRPQLGDLKDSGYIEEIADKVLFLYRPDYYELTEWEDGEFTEGQIEVMVAKNNLGQLKNIRMSYQPANGKLEELDDLKRNTGWEVPVGREKELE